MKYKKLYTILSYWKYFPFLFNLMKYKKTNIINKLYLYNNGI